MPFLTKRELIQATLFSNEVKTKLITNEDKNLWKFRNNQPQHKIHWFLQKNVLNDL